MRISIRGKPRHVRDQQCFDGKIVTRIYEQKNCNVIGQISKQGFTCLVSNAEHDADLSQGYHRSE